MTPNWYRLNHRVRYKETDQMGVVHHANYIAWFEGGRTEWMRHYELDYRDLERRGLFLPVRDVAVHYVSPAHFDDCVAIFTCLSACSAVRLEFTYAVCVLNEDDFEAEPTGSKCDAPIGTALVQGTTTHICVNARWKTARLDRLAPDLLARLQRAL